MAVKTEHAKITWTKNYRLFNRSDENRQLNIPKHKKLRASMKKYGFLACFPVGCIRDMFGKLVVKDGQHRLAIAEELGLAVPYVVVSVDFDVAEINDTPKTWAMRDYAEKHSANGIEAYRDGLEYCDIHKIPVGLGFSLLAGTASFSNVVDSFKDGTFEIKDRAYADAVASLYSRLCDLSPDVRNCQLVAALMSVCRVPEFDHNRLMKGASQCREKLVAYSTRDGYMDMLEDIYNFKRMKLFALKVTATQAMRERNACASKTTSA